ncbi:uncharacterized protein Pyn_18295 [Prunus yedoensis var. nudiflora]|uniref:Uncharacterized protein n=1 Tax=Prunus yedoensis var. nudiflora TaxID=2094558 RepID=A0A314UJD4_PRUYE|nr:uncharacterized protein Pyn_18295 [Prunus yedoensis var. nudiflora]
MFAKLFNKSSPQEASHPQASVSVHYGIPSTASILALDRTQSLLAIGTLDGRIKVLGGDNIEALLTSPKPKPLPFKNLEVSKFRMFPGSHKSLDLCIV